MTVRLFSDEKDPGRHKHGLATRAGQAFLLTLTLLVAVPVNGAVIDFTTSGAFSGTGFGNAYVTPEVKVTAWAHNRRSSGSPFESAQVTKWIEGSLGVCNPFEGVDCPTNDPNGTAAMDNNHPDSIFVDPGADHLLFEFASPTLVNTLSFIPPGLDFLQRDFDFFLWGGTGSIDMMSLTRQDLGTPGYDPFNPDSRRLLGFYEPGVRISIFDLETVLGSPIDWLVAGAANQGGNDLAGIIAINDPTPSPVPLPPVALLFGTGLVGLLGYARRKGLCR